MHIRNDKGFTLLEVIIAMGILGIGIIAMYSMQVSGVQGNATASRITTTTTWAADQIEKMVTMEYKDPGMDDTDADGTNQDADWDGVDDSGGDFGLGDIGAAADGSQTTPDGKYTVYWNVAIDHPVTNTKTVRIIVESTVNQKQVQLQYMKADPL